LLNKAAVEQQFLTGLIYFDQTTPPFDQQMDLIPEPLATLPESRIRPPASALGAILQRFR
jgi:2-oxoglutarate ferredoxin oxidoreductase subunit beta